MERENMPAAAMVADEVDAVIGVDTHTIPYRGAH